MSGSDHFVEGDDALNDVLLSGITRGDFVKGAGGIVAGSALLGASAELARAAGADPSQRRGGVLQVAIGEARPADHLDPVNILDLFMIVLTTALYDTLVAYDERTWETKPSLADEWRASKDSRTWTFQIGRNYRWSDGKPVTAADVAWSYRRSLDPQYTPNIYNRLSSVLDPSGIRVVDRRTLRLVLKSPDPFLPLAIGQRDARIIQNGQGRVKGQVNGVGTGAFKLKNFAPGVSAELERNPLYRERGLPYLDGLRLVVIPEQATKVQSVMNGASHFSDALAPSLIPVVRGSGGRGRLWVAHNVRMHTIVMQQDQPPFNDNRVRTAFKLAIDRKRMISIASRGYGSWTKDTPIANNDPLYPPGLRNIDRDLAMARRLLAAAGHPNGLTVTLNTTDLNGEKELALAFAAQVKEAGFDVRIREHDAATYRATVWEKVPMFTFAGFTRRHFSEMIAATLLGAFNDPKWSDPRLATLMQQARVAPDKKRQTALYRQAAALVANNSGWVIPHFYHIPYAAKPSVRGVDLNGVPLIGFKRATIR